MDKVKAIAGIVVAIVGLFCFLHPSVELVYKYDSFSFLVIYAASILVSCIYC